jgi:ATP-dependent Clp protease adaptor protein ClpS
MVKEKLDPVKQNKKSTSEIKDLILYNDDFNTFEFVIESLVEVCGHDMVQAEQCALIAHFKGKCTVKSGPVNELKPMKDEMSNRELTVSIS